MFPIQSSRADTSWLGFHCPCLFDSPVKLQPVQVFLSMCSSAIVISKQTMPQPASSFSILLTHTFLILLFPNHHPSASIHALLYIPSVSPTPSKSFSSSIVPHLPCQYWVFALPRQHDSSQTPLSSFLPAARVSASAAPECSEPTPTGLFLASPIPQHGLLRWQASLVAA